MKKSARKKAHRRAPARPKFNLDYSAKIKVIGVGGGGGNAISRMRDSATIKGVDFIGINTDKQDLDYCNAKHKIYIGKNLTKGMGAGMNPDIGRQAAEENRSEIVEAIKDSDLVFITAGLGGGTGSGASAVVAEAARELGALTIAVVTKPFAFEGSQRARIAQDALLKLKEKVDAIIVIPNDRIFSIIPKDTPFLKAFEYIDDVLKNAVQGMADLIAQPGIVNVDFADVRTIMQGAGSALVGIGIAGGQNRANDAVTQAVNSPLLEVAIDGAKGVLFGVSGGRDLKMNEVNDIAHIITEKVDPSAKIIFGAYHDKRIKVGQIKVTLIATGFNGSNFKNNEMSMTNLFSSPSTASTASASESFAPEIPKKETRILKDPPSTLAKPDSEAELWDIPTFLRRKKK